MKGGAPSPHRAPAEGGQQGFLHSDLSLPQCGDAGASPPLPSQIPLPAPAFPLTWLASSLESGWQTEEGVAGNILRMPGTCPPSAGAPKARRTGNPGARPGCLFPITLPLHPPFWCCPPSTGRGAAGFLRPHTCSCAAACRPPRVCRPTWVSLPLPGEGRALTLCLSTCPLALMLVQTQRAHILSFRLLCGGGESSKNRCRCWVIVFGGG